MFYRVTYDDVGVYEVLKKLIWDDKSNFSKKDWENFKASDDVNWLTVPNTYGIIITPILQKRDLSCLWKKLIL